MASQEIEGNLSTTLRTAARTGNLEFLKQMINKGADVNTNNYGDKTALMLATENGNLEAVKLLINAGADVNDVNVDDYGGKTALILATENGNLDAVKLLINAGADVNESGYKTISPLMASTQNGHITVVRLLISAGANVNMLCNGYAALYWAARNDHSECLSALLEAGAREGNAYKIDDGDPVIGASYWGHFVYVNMLIEDGADVNERNSSLETAFILAAVRKRYKTLKLLLNAGADVNVADMDSSTALTRVACRYGGQDLSMLRFLLRIGVKINFVGFRHLLCYPRLEKPENALMKCLRLREDRRESALLLFAAGETIDESALKTVPEYLLPQKDINLMDICRGRIRKHLLDLDPYTHLFDRVPRLGLPATVTDFLVYNQTLDDTQDD